MFQEGTNLTTLQSSVRASSNRKQLTNNMCVVLAYFFTLRMSIFEKIMLDDILLTKHHVIKAERAQKKSRNGAIGLVGNYPRSKLPFRRINVRQDMTDSEIEPIEHVLKTTHLNKFKCLNSFVMRVVVIVIYLCNYSGTYSIHQPKW